jgi:hypothetical protein
MAITSTTLAVAAGRGDLTLVLASASGAVTGNTIVIGGEYLQQTGAAVGVIIPVRRGLQGSASIPHAAATVVKMGLASDFNLAEPTQAAVYVDGTTVTGDGSSGTPLSAVDATGGVTLAGDNAFTGANSMAQSLTFATTTGVRSSTTTAETFVIQGYDVDGTAYKTFATVTNGNTPSMAIAAPSGGTLSVAATTLSQGGNAISLAGALTTAGAFATTITTTGTTGVTLPTTGTLLVGNGVSAGPFTSITSITVVNGLVTALTGS